MLAQLRQKFRDYVDRNERAHALARYPTDQELQQCTAIPLLSDADTGLAALSGTGLCVLEIFNDEITPIDYVVYVIQRFSKRDKLQATHLALQVHGTGSGQLAAGARTTLEAVAKLIEEDAIARQFPFKCAVRAV